MWNELANSLEGTTTTHQRNYLYDCLNSAYYIDKALRELEDYTSNYKCPKKSMSFYRNHVFVQSLGYYQENPDLNTNERKNITNVRKLGFAYHNLDNLLSNGKMRSDEASLKMRSMLEGMYKGICNALLLEIERWDIISKVSSVADQKSYISNIIGDSNEDKINFMLNFINNKIN